MTASAGPETHSSRNDERRKKRKRRQRLVEKRKAQKSDLKAAKSRKMEKKGIAKKKMKNNPGRGWHSIQSSSASCGSDSSAGVDTLSSSSLSEDSSNEEPEPVRQPARKRSRKNDGVCETVDADGALVWHNPSITSYAKAAAFLKPTERFRWKVFGQQTVQNEELSCSPVKGNLC